LTIPVPREKNTWDAVKRVALDEIAMRKGHQDFVTVVGDIERGDLLEVIDSHRSEQLIEVLNQQPIEVRAQVEEVSIDIWGGFPKVIAQVFPNAVLVYDRFHVMKLVNTELSLFCHFKQRKTGNPHLQWSVEQH